MRKQGFFRGQYNPCLDYHKQRNLRTFLHWDDFATVGSRSEVQWFKDSLEKRFEIKTQCVGFQPARQSGAGEASTGRGLASSSVVGAGTGSGPSPTTAHGEPMVEGSEGRLLNRIIRCTHKGAGG